MIPSSLAMVVGVFGLIFCAGFLLMLLADSYHAKVDVRLREIPKTNKSTAAGNRIAPLFEVASLLAKWSTLVDRLTPDSERDRQRHQLRLLQAGIYDPIAFSAFFVAKLALMISPSLLGFIAGWFRLVDMQSGLLWGGVAGGCGMILPSVWLDRQIRSRNLVLRRSLTDFLDLMIVCLESGLSLQGTIQ